MDAKVLIAARLIPNNQLPIKIIGNDRLAKPFEIHAHVFTAGAKKAIAEAKGKISIIK